jgi:hypothetical protein
VIIMLFVCLPPSPFQYLKQMADCYEICILCYVTTTVSYFSLFKTSNNVMIYELVRCEKTLKEQHRLRVFGNGAEEKIWP